MIVPYPIPRIWKLIDRENIRVVWYPDDSFPRARYCLADRRPVLFVSPYINANSMRTRCTLAHELGHHFAAIGPTGTTDVRRNEERAMRWAYEFVLPHKWIRHRLHWEPWRIAEEADVYQEWVEARLKWIWSDWQDKMSRRKAVSSSNG